MEKNLKFSDEDVKVMAGYIIYGLGMTAKGMIKQRWWNKYIKRNEELPEEIIKEIGQTLNMGLDEIQKYGEVL
jgi:hypothetical protein